MDPGGRDSRDRGPGTCWGRSRTRRSSGSSGTEISRVVRSRYAGCRTDATGRRSIAILSIGEELWRVEAETGTREKLISAAELIPAGSSEPLQIEGHTFSADGRRLLIFTESQQVWRARTQGRYYVFDFPTRRLIPVSDEDGWQMFAKLSPDARQVAFVRDHDLYVTDLSSGEERRLTFDGSDTIINGTTDWVYEEELNLRNAFRWSPDGSRIAYWQLDQSPVRMYFLIDALPLYPELHGIRYPKAGESNSRVKVGSIELTSGETTWFDIGTEEDIYIARMEWAASSDEVVIHRLNRHQSQIDLLLGDARTGRTTLLFSEQDEAWVDADDDLHWIDSGQRFTWTSDRDGFSHVYLYDRSGRMLRQLTRGNWDVTAFHGLNEETGRIYFTAAPESPLTRSVYSAPLDGGDMIRIAGGRGTHSARFSPDFGLFTDTYSSIGTPPTTTLRRAADGAEVRVIEDNADLVQKIEALDLREPEFFTVRADDGSSLNAWIIKPREFDPGRSYPMLLYVYGGPRVADRAGRLGRQPLLVASDAGTGWDPRRQRRQPGNGRPRPRVQEAGLHATGTARDGGPAGRRPPARRAALRGCLADRDLGLELRRVHGAYDVAGRWRTGGGSDRGSPGHVLGAVRHDLYGAVHAHAAGE